MTCPEGAQRAARDSHELLLHTGITTASSYCSIAFIFNHLSEPSLKEFKRQFSLNIKINFYFVKKRLNIFSFNLDTRIHTSPKEDGHGSQALGPKGVVFRRKDR